MRDLGPQPFGDLAMRLRAQLEEHEARRQSDPAYAAKVARAEHDREQREAAAEMDTRRRFLAEAGVPDRLLAPLTRWTVHETPPVVTVRSWLRDGCRPPFLVLAGGKGTGKTTGGCVAISERGGRRVAAREVAAASDFDRDFLRPLARASLLVLDDLGAESLDAGGWALNRIVGLLDARYEADLPTVLCTNLTLPDFLARYDRDGGRLRDRLREAARWIAVPGESMRQPSKGPPHA